MEDHRPTAVAGLFYPENPRELTSLVNDELLQVNTNLEYSPLAVIVPHAGYIYSGAIAASVYKYIQTRSSIIKRVLLIGPSHRVGFHGMALSSADFFDTPLGAIKIDTQARESLLQHPDVHLVEQAHTSEHSLEVQLPFLQIVLDEFSLIPIVVGNASPESISEIINSQWDGKETLVVVSSDLSHYHDYQTAQKLDSDTSQAILDFDYSAIHSANACGYMGINGLLLFAQEHSLKPSVIDLRNSGDTAGDKASVVGYGAYLFGT